MKVGNKCRKEEINILTIFVGTLTSLLHNDTHNLIIVTNVRASHTKKKKTII
jgi:hypothetical protein